MRVLFLSVALASWCLPAHSACPRARAADIRAHLGSLCARVYAHNNCVGPHRDIAKETQIRALVGFNDVASSLVVASNCKLSIYEHGGFQGHSRHLFGREPVYSSLAYVRRGGFWSGSHWNDVISSVKCTCKGIGGGLHGVARATTTARPA